MGIVEKAKNLLVGKKERTIVDNIKEKGFESPVLDKVYEFSLNKFSQRTIEENRERIQQLRGQLESLDERYVKSGYSEKVLKEFSKLKAEIQELQELTDRQQRILSRNQEGPRLSLDDEEKQDLLKALEPFKADENAALEDFQEKYDALKESLINLKSKRSENVDLLRQIAALFMQNLDSDSKIWVYNKMAGFPVGNINLSIFELENHLLEQENFEFILR